jgi:hypothetical protein
MITHVGLGERLAIAAMGGEKACFVIQKATEMQRQLPR